MSWLSGEWRIKKKTNIYMYIHIYIYIYVYIASLIGGINLIPIKIGILKGGILCSIVLIFAIHQYESATGIHTSPPS